MRQATAERVQAFGLLTEDEMLILDAPLSEVLAQAASRASMRGLMGEEQHDEDDESERPTTPAPFSGDR